jgi:basic membrane protein A and related proteins
MFKRLAQVWLAALVIAALLAGASGSGVAPVSASNAHKVTKIAIATPAKANDYGWNQQGYRAAKTVAAWAHASLTANTGVGYDNTASVLRRLAAGGTSFVIAQASGYNTVAPRIAQQTRVPMISYDNPKNLIKGYMSDIETQSQQGAYLAGVLAAKKTKTNILGIVISAADTNWYKETGGFVAGARSVKKNVKFQFNQIGPAAYDDAAGGKRVAQAVIAAGADVFFGMGDGASFGYLAAAENAKAGHKVWFIDVIGNKTPIDTHHILLSSVLWNFTTVFKRAVTDINKGTFGTHYYNLNASDGISLLKTPYIPASVWTLIEKDRHLIITGKLKVPATPTEAKVKAILKHP